MARCNLSSATRPQAEGRRRNGGKSVAACWWIPESSSFWQRTTHTHRQPRQAMFCGSRNGQKESPPPCLGISLGPLMFSCQILNILSGNLQNLAEKLFSDSPPETAERWLPSQRSHTFQPRTNQSHQIFPPLAAHNPASHSLYHHGKPPLLSNGRCPIKTHA
jgi:hypothetical protein